jgi:hypothetical protein
MTFTQKLVNNVKNLPGDMFKNFASRLSNLAHKPTVAGDEEFDIPALYDDPLY